MLLGTAAGAVLYRVALWAGRRSRGLTMQLVVGCSALAGSLLGAGILFSALFVGPQALLSFDSLSFWLYTGITVASLVAWLR